MVSWEKEQITSEAMEAARVACNKYLTKPQHIDVAIEALRRAKFKFAGRQKIVVSKKWGFTKYKQEDYIEWKRQGRIESRGVHAKVIGTHGPIAKRTADTAFLK